MGGWVVWCGVVGKIPPRSKSPSLLFLGPMLKIPRGFIGGGQRFVFLLKILARKVFQWRVQSKKSKKSKNCFQKCKFEHIKCVKIKKNVEKTSFGAFLQF